MLQVKKKGHSIYEIQRKREFIENVNTLNSLYPSARDEVLAIAQSANTQALAAFIVNNPTFELCPKNSMGRTIMHVLAESNDVNGMKLVLSTVEDDKEKLVCMRLEDDTGMTPVLIAYLHESNDVLQFLEKYGVKSDEFLENEMVAHSLASAGGVKALKTLKGILDKCETNEEKEEVLCKRTKKNLNTPLMLAAQKGREDSVKFICGYHEQDIWPQTAPFLKGGKTLG